MSAAQNRADREHLARVQDAAPKLLEACVEAREYLNTLSNADYFHARRHRLARLLTAAIAATQPPAKRKGTR